MSLTKINHIHIFIHKNNEEKITTYHYYEITLINTSNSHKF